MTVKQNFGMFCPHCNKAIYGWLTYGVEFDPVGGVSPTSPSPAVNGDSVVPSVGNSAGKTGPGAASDPSTGIGQPPAPLIDKDSEIKAIEAVAPHLTLPGPLFQRLKETGVVKYPGMMSDRINCLRGLSVEQLRYIRTGVRA